MELMPNLLFFILFSIGIGFFVLNIKKLIYNIKLGKDIDRYDNKSERWKNMILLALGQSKMIHRPISGVLHVIVYIGFILINIELLEIVTDGLLGTHRVFAPFMGGFYDFLIATFEILAFFAAVMPISESSITKIFDFCKPKSAAPKLYPSGSGFDFI